MADNNNDVVFAESAQDFDVAVGPDADGAMRQLHVSKDAFQKSVHAKRSCLECHQDIQQIPHQTNVDRRVGCVE